MRYVLCLLDRAWRGISDAQREPYERLPRSRGLNYAWRSLGPAAVLTAWDDPWGDHLVVQDGDWNAIGIARLDNRRDIEHRLESWEPGSQLTDLQLIVRFVARHGLKRLGEVLGDFAFAAWNSSTHSLTAGTDALSVRKLFFADRANYIGFATRAEALALEDRYEARYLADFISLCPATPDLTAYEGVRRLPAGTTAVINGGGLKQHTFWTPDAFEPSRFTPALERDAPVVLRDLLSSSIQQRLARDGNTWAQLSGGVDSSSIVSMAQWLATRSTVPHGVAGTVTFVDWQGTDADEREYSDLVAARWKVRNETIVDPPLWADGTAPPPHLDLPRDSLLFFPRERRLCDIVRKAGARVLLAGFGSDELFTGTIIYFADWVARGRVWPAARQLAHWAARGRVSFWAIAYENALLPLVPRSLRRPSSYDDGRLLPWITEGAAKRYDLRRRTQSVTGGEGRFGHKYRDAMLTRLAAMARLDAGSIGDVLDVRYPFLSRPLVEFALRLPPELCSRPHARKWVLREALRGILPEPVRTRVGKGGPTDLMVRSLSSHRSLLAPLVDAPMLAELGLVEPSQLRLALEQAPYGVHGERNLSTDVQKTLMTEAWLQIRSGWWPPEVPQ